MNFPLGKNRQQGFSRWIARLWEQITTFWTNDNVKDQSNSTNVRDRSIDNTRLPDDNNQPPYRIGKLSTRETRDNEGNLTVELYRDRNQPFASDMNDEVLSKISNDSVRYGIKARIAAIQEEDTKQSPQR